MNKDGIILAAVCALATLAGAVEVDVFANTNMVEDRWHWFMGSAGRELDIGWPQDVQDHHRYSEVLSHSPISYGVAENVFDDGFVIFENQDGSDPFRVDFKTSGTVTFDTLRIIAKADAGTARRGFKTVRLYARNSDTNFVPGDLVCSADVTQDFEAGYGQNQILLKISDVGVIDQTHFRVEFDVDPIGSTWWGPRILRIEAVNDRSYAAPTVLYPPSAPAFALTSSVPRMTADAFEGAAVTDSFLANEPEKLFGHGTEIFGDSTNSGICWVEFQTAAASNINTLELSLQMDAGSGGRRAASTVRLYAREGTDTGNWLADEKRMEVEIDPDYEVYGNHQIRLRVYGLNSAGRSFRTFRLEFDIAKLDGQYWGPRVHEVEAWNEPMVFPKGVACLFPTGGSADKADWRPFTAVNGLDYMQGSTVYYDWKLLEPADDVYDWRWIDEPLAIASNHNQKLAIGIQPNWYSPDWLKAQTTNYVAEHGHPNIGIVTNPVPWDPVYLAELHELIDELGARYNGHPNIRFVCINGPALSSGLECNFPIKNIDAANRAVLDYTYAKAVQGWKASIDRYAAAFPDTLLSLGLHRGFYGWFDAEPVHVELIRDIRDYAIEKEVYGNEKPFALRLLGLLDPTVETQNTFWSEHYDGGEENVTDFYRMIWERKDEVFTTLESTSYWINKDYTGEQVGGVLVNGTRHEGWALEIKEGDWWVNFTAAPHEQNLHAPRYAYRQALLDGSLRQQDVEFWKQHAYEGSTYPVDKDADPDGDGLSNYMEWIFGRDPEVADSLWYDVFEAGRTADGRRTLAFGFHRGRATALQVERVGSNGAAEILWSLDEWDAFSTNHPRVESVDEGTNGWVELMLAFDDLHRSPLGYREVEDAATAELGYALWAAAWGGLGAAEADDDGDGLGNLGEYALGGNPTNVLDVGFVPVLKNGNGAMEYVHAFRADAGDLVYVLETTEDLMAGNWTNTGYAAVSTNWTGGAFGVITNTISTEKDRTFIRLVVEKP